MKPSVSAIKENIKFVRDFMDKENIKYDMICLTPTGFVCDVRGYSVTFSVHIELVKFTNIRDSKIKYRIGRWMGCSGPFFEFTTNRRWESIYFLQTIKHLGIEEGVKFFEKLSKRKEMISAIKEDFD